MTIDEHIKRLTEPVSDKEMLAFLIEDLEWERDTYRDAFIDSLKQQMVREIKRFNN